MRNNFFAQKIKTARLFFFFIVAFLFSPHFSFAQFQHFLPVEVYGSDYFAFSAGSDIFFRNIDKEVFPATFQTDAAYISKYFNGQAAFLFQNNQTSIAGNVSGSYTFPFNLTLGAETMLNFNSFHKYGNEFDWGAVGFVSYRTSNPKFWWRFEVMGGMGLQGNFIKYSGNNYLPAEWNKTYFLNLSFQTVFLFKNMIYLDIRSFENFNYNYGYSPNFALGYKYFLGKNWIFSGELEAIYSSFLTTNGLLRKVRVFFGATYILPKQ